MNAAAGTQPDLPPTIDAEKLELLRRDMEDVERGMAYLRERSIDAAHYRAAEGPPKTSESTDTVRSKDTTCRLM